MRPGNYAIYGDGQGQVMGGNDPTIGPPMVPLCRRSIRPRRASFPGRPGVPRRLPAGAGAEGGHGPVRGPVRFLRLPQRGPSRGTTHQASGAPSRAEPRGEGHRSIRYGPPAMEPGLSVDQRSGAQAIDGGRNRLGGPECCPPDSEWPWPVFRAPEVPPETTPNPRNVPPDEERSLSKTRLGSGSPP